MATFARGGSVSGPERLPQDSRARVLSSPALSPFAPISPSTRFPVHTRIRKLILARLIHRALVPGKHGGRGTWFGVWNLEVVVEEVEVFYRRARERIQHQRHLLVPLFQIIYLYFR